MKDFYAELPIAVRVTGSYHDLGEFVGDVAQMPRIVTLNDIAIESIKDGSLKFDATAVTYRYLDDDEVARLRKEKAKEKAGK
jgi:type IV pilus assembly protein PilO